jgi:hypothetical protein
MYINKYQVRCGLAGAGSRYCMVVIYYGKIMIAMVIPI